MPKSKLVKELDSLNEEPITRPASHGSLEFIFSESLMLFGWNRWQHKDYRSFYGIGLVYRVVKGDKFDLVYVRFGTFPNIKTRLVVVFDNHARRQILTLKRGQYCQVYGVCRYFTSEKEVNGKKLKCIKLGLYAKGISGWYVPTMMDIKKMPINDDLVNPTEKEEEMMNSMEDILDQFLNGTGEEE